ncbi:pyruvate dehydrogenase (acetyl-transferring) E1 component subunit alpha [Alkalimarinus alittae]|uniref:Pyruvate dehydrogenase E1 component subunit alpha n=1 Tax=Alkalimarinus alittae TaxID=2961619 RepID=A0ABY6N317_9ALTE|nr:pyruvate dehydrogenase (acetyl-transferring) E1 component subunit alpha [Alkalimarinus alittae]UZE96481.1 pyruvate dehydrogenase (acetyl-transferring) E1 component subunit alpha [Alkalimarinus alittae]
MNRTYDFSVNATQFIADDGSLIKPLPSTVDETILLQAYQEMVLIRIFDQKAIALQRTGKLGTYPSSLGQESIGIAIGLAMQACDVFVPYYRDQATQYLRGVSLTEMLQYWGGDERGSHYQNCTQDMPICVPIATQFCHAAGIATAFKIRGEKRVSVVTGGDGSTSKGDFLESLNLSGVWQLPMVMVINNNQWAISTRREVQSHSETLAQKAISAGIPGVQVDGNDFVSLYDAMLTALKRARAGKGPTLIEAISYRLSDHTTADDATRYRSHDELKKGWDREPIKRLRDYLLSLNLWDPDKENQLQEKVKEQVDNAVTAYLAIQPEPATAMFDHLFKKLPAPMQAQYDEVKRLHLS